MSRNPFTTLILLVTLLSSLTTAFSISLLPRQQNSQDICAQYSTIANLSIVGANATMRAAYLAASPEGSDAARAPLDAAIPLLPSFKFNETINSECGNLTTVAMKGAATNFSEGVVLQFKIAAANSASVLGGNVLGAVLLVGVVVGIVV